MTKLRLTLGFLVIVVLLMSGCIKENQQPAYIYIDNIFFEADTSLGQGSSSSDIVDVWPSIDGQQLGANNLSATFPVILDQNFATNSIKISAGIKENGISNTRVIYPFYEPYVVNLILTPGKVDTFRPTLNYAANATVIIVEDFEQPHLAVFTDDIDENPNTEMINQTTDVFEGTYSGLLVLDSANLDCTVASTPRYSNLQPPGTSFQVYLEMNYKTNSPFQVGLIAHYGSGSETIYKGGANASTEWKKIYFNITTEIFGANAPEYSILFRVINNQSLEQPLIYLDNIKLLHF
jgi:hypothetical protein